ncbi:MULTISPECIES: hypothetical protein [unclassified Marinobacter]|uniref:hypothetical protein n=1 Tax=unclassified Marinobacter TaxID=83889 RepID=UPI00200D9250|nr:MULTISPECIES: hypothetical protein [unclassified Marinobacter]MCL1481078.1 hypothetical protein [Marinobacter sp.]MCL1486032.1 hypothetical protein [Marinobacter sp.]MCL1488038.1 hypothetical protein [Marinobacter sp.]UQG56040.1 hypothetical protein MIH16_22060 [Marinobacter sp. M4C]UQG64844.1 hypothetical protein MIH17_22055 [Marinobacter sp. M2C]
MLIYWRLRSTCHHLASSVDSGQIIDVTRFHVARAETASSLRLHVGADAMGMRGSYV